MAKKIIQYCYFGEDAMATGYEPYIYTDDNSFADKIQEGSLYYLWELNETATYIQLDVGKTYDPSLKYYTLIPRSRVNYPTTITKASLVSGSIFNNITPIIKLGIQAIPGTKFRLNSNNEWIIIGMTGVYELDLTSSSATIIKLQFDEVSLDIIDKNENAYLIIDIVAELKGG